MAALPKLRPSPSEAGVPPLSESAISALSRELHMQVHTPRQCVKCQKAAVFPLCVRHFNI